MMTFAQGGNLFRPSVDFGNAAWKDTKREFMR